MRILLVEDDAPLAEALIEVLESESHAVDHAAGGDDASELVDVNPYDLVILDWEIPGPAGIELLESWRGAGLGVPVLLVTGSSSPADRVCGLDAGADDCLTKPFATRELLARMRSLLRRCYTSAPAPVAAGDLEMDRAAHRVLIGGEGVALTPREFALLEYFLGNVGRVVTRVDISEHVWNHAFDSFANVVDITVHRLRRKVDGGREAKLIHTVRGVGYALRPERAVPS